MLFLSLSLSLSFYSFIQFFQLFTMSLSLDLPSSPTGSMYPFLSFFFLQPFLLTWNKKRINQFFYSFPPIFSFTPFFASPLSISIHFNHSLVPFRNDILQVMVSRQIYYKVLVKKSSKEKRESEREKGGKETERGKSASIRST